MQAEDNASKSKLRLAVEEYKAALALDPNHTAHNIHLHLGLCKVYVKLGRGKDAITSCTEVLEIDRDLVEALVQVIFCYCAYCPNNGKGHQKAIPLMLSDLSVVEHSIFLL